MATFLELTDTSSPAVPDGYLRWDATGTEIVYQTNINADSITGIALSAKDGKLTSLVDTDAIAVPDGFLRWNAGGTVVDYITAIPSSAISGLSTVATSGDYTDLVNTPAFATVALSGDYSDLINIVPTDWTDITNKPSDFSPSAHTHAIVNVTGLQAELDAKADADILLGYTVDYDTQVTNKPSIPVNDDFTLLGLSDTLNVPTGNAYLRWNASGTQVQYDQYIDSSDVIGLSTVSLTGQYSDLSGTPALAAVALSGDYSDLINSPDLGLYALNSTLSVVSFTGSYNDLLNQPALFSGSYLDLTQVPSEFVPAPHTHVEADITDLVVPKFLNDLTDVNATPVDKNVLAYDSGTGKWVAATTGSFASLDEVSSEPVANGYLRWSTDATEILYEDKIPASAIAGLSPVAFTGMIEDMADIELTSVINGQVLEYLNGVWVNTTLSGGGGGGALDDLTDVTITAVADNDFLSYNSGSGQWENIAVGFAGDIIQNGAGTTFADASGDPLVLVANTDIELNSGAGFIRVFGEITSLTDNAITAAADVILQGTKWPNTAGTVGQVLLTDGVDQTAWSTLPDFGQVESVSSATANISVDNTDPANPALTLNPDLVLASLLVTSTTPQNSIVNEDASADRGNWKTSVNSSGTWLLETATDLDASASALFSATRTGTAIDLLTVGTSIDATGFNIASTSMTANAFNGVNLGTSGSAFEFLSGDGNYNVTPNIGNIDFSIPENRQVEVTGNNVLIFQSTGVNTLNNSSLALGYDFAILNISIDGTPGDNSITLSDTDMLVTDNAFSKGLTYETDYSANYTDRSLVDSNYVKTNFFQSSASTLFVGSAADLPAVVGDVHIIPLGTTIVLEGMVDIGANRIELVGNASIIGIDSSSTGITSSNAVSTLFYSSPISIQKSDIKNATIINTSVNEVSIICDDSNVALVIENSGISGNMTAGVFRAIILNSVIMQSHTLSFTTTTTGSVSIDKSGLSYAVPGNSIEVQNGVVLADMQITKTEFITVPGSAGVALIGTGTVSKGSIEGGRWINAGGSFTTGFDHKSDEWMFAGIDGSTDSSDQMIVQIESNPFTAEFDCVINTVDVWEPLAAPATFLYTSSGDEQKYTLTDTTIGEVTYNGVRQKGANISFYAVVENNANNDVIELAVAINGVVSNKTIIRYFLDDPQPEALTSPTVTLDLSPGDTMCVMVRNRTNNNDFGVYIAKMSVS